MDTRGFEVLELLETAPPRLQSLSGTGVEATREGQRWRLVAEPLARLRVHPWDSTGVGEVMTQFEQVLQSAAPWLSSLVVRGGELGVEAAARIKGFAAGVPVTFEWAEASPAQSVGGLPGMFGGSSSDG